MPELHLPLIEAAILFPLIGAILVSRMRQPETARRWSLAFAALALFSTTVAWQDFIGLGVPLAHDHWDFIGELIGRNVFAIDAVTAPLLPLISLLYTLTILATLRTKIRRFSFAWTMASMTLTLGTFCCQDEWGIIALLALATLPPFFELRSRGKSTRVYAIHMAAYVGLMVFGWSCVCLEGSGAVHSLFAVLPLLIAVLIRSGIAPTHVWLTDLYENATFGTALLFTTPLSGAYAILHLVLPIAPGWVLQSMGLVSLMTAIYAGGMAMIQKDARRFFSYLFLSQSSLVLVGLESASHVGLTGGLCVWASVVLALGGLGLTLRAVESRFGHFSLTSYRGLYEHVPLLAVCFLLTGLGSVGFPGTIGFVGTEILIDGVVEVYPHIGAAVVIAAAFNGIAIVRAYFLLFTGAKHASSISLNVGLAERTAVLTLAILILGGGFLPQPGIAMSSNAATEIISARPAILAPEDPQKSSDDDEQTSEHEHHTEVLEKQSH